MKETNKKIQHIQLLPNRHLNFFLLVIVLMNGHTFYETLKCTHTNTDTQFTIVYNTLVGHV